VLQTRVHQRFRRSPARQAAAARLKSGRSGRRRRGAWTLLVLVAILLSALSPPGRAAEVRTRREALPPGSIAMNAGEYGKAWLAAAERRGVELEWVQDEPSVLRVRFAADQPWPAVLFRPETLRLPADWTGFGGLLVTVSTPEPNPVRVNVRVDAAGDHGKWRQGGIDIEPGKIVDILFRLDVGDPILGMIGQPPPELPPGIEAEIMPDSGVRLDLRHVTRFQFFGARPKQPYTIDIHRLVLLKGAIKPKVPFVDRYGQYNGADWPRKIHADTQFPARIAAEDQDLAAHPPPAEHDRYGGWADGPKLDASGHFQVRKIDGVWWLVDPDGRLFWSAGVDCVRMNTVTTVAGRECCFEWLPEPGSPFARFYSGGGKRRRFDFYSANLFRKYGETFRQAFLDRALRRLRSWGFNTIGNWSSPDVWRKRRMPYTIPVHPRNAPRFPTDTFTKAGKSRTKWFPDVFDPRFAEAVDAAVAKFAEFAGDPMLLGVFVDNELPWIRRGVRVAESALRLDGGEHAVKRGLVAFLREKYNDIAALNAAWGTRFADWQALAAPLTLSSEQRKRAETDLAELDREIARRYFTACREAVRRRLPGALYLGCRFSSFTPEVVDVARRFCDVVSFNIYAERPSARTADELAHELDFPVLIGEYHFGALDRGMFHPGLRRTRNQNDRAGHFAAYLKEAATAPWCVGAHWFQYLDQALTGRFDGENYNIGFVTVVDEPYPEMRSAARRVTRDMYRLRWAAARAHGGAPEQ